MIDIIKHTVCWHTTKYISTLIMRRCMKATILFSSPNKISNNVSFGTQGVLYITILHLSQHVIRNMALVYTRLQNFQ